ncbi:MAG: hypothetical protein MJ231_02245 [bacterium]|nr:hypothetical protein [bacterium]
MSENKKTDSEITKDYQAKMTMYKIAFPKADENNNIPDYNEMIKNRALELGFTVEKGRFKGDGNVNAYVLHLIEKDLGIEMIKGFSKIKKKEKTYSDEEIEEANKLISDYEEKMNSLKEFKKSPEYLEALKKLKSNNK